MTTLCRTKNEYPFHANFMRSARKLRKEQGLSQAEVAAMIGISDQQYSRLEKCIGFKPVSLDEAVRIASALKSSILVMTFGKGNTESWLTSTNSAINALEKSKERMERSVKDCEELLNTFIKFRVGLDSQFKKTMSEITKQLNSR